MTSDSNFSDIPCSGRTARRLRLVGAVAAIVGAFTATTALRAHDLFLTLTSYRVPVGRVLRVTVLNGTFSSSENYITRDRLQDVSLVAGGARAAVDTGRWSATRDSTRSFVILTPKAAGTYVLAASVKPRVLELDGKAFNAYLADEGLEDVVAERRAAGELEQRSHESYSKHVKTIFQAGDQLTDDYAKVLGYPAEIVPRANPYALHRGDTLVVTCLVNGQPAPGVVVLAGGRTSDGKRLAVQRLRAAGDGTARIHLQNRGAWYVKFIRMTRVSDTPGGYESLWSTLTFGVR